MGMVTTADGWWYIANSGDSNVLVYRTTRKGPKGPKATLRDDGEVPVNVAVTPIGSSSPFRTAQQLEAAPEA